VRLFTGIAGLLGALVVFNDTRLQDAMSDILRWPLIDLICGLVIALICLRTDRFITRHRTVRLLAVCALGLTVGSAAAQFNVLGKEDDYLTPAFVLLTAVLMLIASVVLTASALVDLRHDAK
jgi:uncharacterized membrane protein